MTNDDPAPVGTLILGVPSPSLPTCGLGISSCEREGRGKGTGEPPGPDEPLSLSSSPTAPPMLPRSSPSKLNLRHPTRWSPRDNQPEDCL